MPNCLDDVVSNSAGEVTALTFVLALLAALGGRDARFDGFVLSRRGVKKDGRGVLSGYLRALRRFMLSAAILRSTLHRWFVNKKTILFGFVLDIEMEGLTTPGFPPDIK